MIGLVSAAGAAVMSVAGAIAPGVARADDPPALPNINAFAPVKTSEYAVMDNNWYAFRTPDGLTCVLQRSGGYGCSGPLPLDRQLAAQPAQVAIERTGGHEFSRGQL